MHQITNLDDMLKSLWEIDTTSKRKLTQDEQICEELFQNTTSRSSNGRYIVQLPFKTDKPKSMEGNSREIALRRFKQLEITTEELNQALLICIKKDQSEHFSDDIRNIMIYEYVKPTSHLKTLNPFLDKERVIRVGGRLRHANLSEDSKHPIILDSKSKLTALIVADAHRKTLHGGLQLMLSYLRTKYWIIRAKSIVKSHIFKCLICAKLRAKTRSQLMGDLPSQRVTPSRPFLNSGVDFAGPFNILMSKGKGIRTSKAYIAIFICLSTKAIHLELVSDLTSEAFIAAFKRFVSRRGHCAQMWSDQGRTFIAANRELKESLDEANLESLHKQTANTLAMDGTQWHFIPPYSPTFGGLWEAGVKSMKGHLKRVLTTNLTFEEMSTLLCQVEACLNSRPLTPIDDSDVDNVDPLTPGHFLVGEALKIVPTPNLTYILDGFIHRNF
ncbi:uncharacterized protein LOC106718523 [Papilio machaon]|uniref:uncharacterized protein LOC106718523 n=1 Tax=Papilio machaon TaxID=76193 RepID=UPI001E664B02|nr:uncharacterized protein LOC106718523 [Papilio machaon]